MRQPGKSTLASSSRDAPGQAPHKRLTSRPQRLGNRGKEEAMDRRAVLGSACLAAVGGAVGRGKALARSAGRVRVTGVESFDIQMPAPRTGRFVPTYLRLTAGRNNVVKVTTSAGVSGYSFLGAAPGEAEAAQSLLAGADLFAVDVHVKRGLGPAAEEAVWDAIGKIAGQPLCRLM